MSARAKLNLNTLMVEARALFKGIEAAYKRRGLELPFDWPDPVWSMIDYFGERDVDGQDTKNFLFIRAHRHGNQHGASETDPFPKWFDDLAKSLTVLRLHENPNDAYGHVSRLPLVLRTLNEVLECSGVGEPAKILPQHFADAVKLLNGNPRTRFHKASWLEWVANTLDAKGITPVPLMWKNPLPYPERRQRDRRPSKEAINMLAYCLQNPLDDEDNRDRIALNAAKLHVAWGGRIGETVIAPASNGLLIKEPREGQPGAFNYAVRYDPEKGFHDGASIKPLDRICGEMSEEAYAGLMRLCAPARARAKVLEDNPGRCPIPKPDSDEFYEPDDEISLAELVPHLGLGIYMSGGQTQTNHMRKRIKKTYGVEPSYIPKRGTWATGHQSGDPAQIRYRVGDIEAGILKSFRIELMPLKDPIARKLSECLCVVFEHQLSGNVKTIPLVPRLMTTTDIRDALGAAPEPGDAKDSKSIFDRRGLKINGERVKIIPHSSRHMKNTMLDEAGLSLLMQALVMGRKDPGQSEVYNHPAIEAVQANHLDRLRKLPVADQREIIREWIRKGQAGGEVAARYHELFEDDPLRAEEFLLINTGHVLLTKYGGCLNDWSASEECPRHNKCYHNCRHFHVTGTGSEIAELEEDLRVQEMARAAIVQQIESGRYRATQALEARDSEIAGIKKALEQAYVAKASREKSEELQRKDGNKFGVILPVFPEGEDHFVPLLDSKKSEGE